MTIQNQTLLQNISKENLHAQNVDIRSLFLNYWEELEIYPNYVDLGMGMPPLSMFQAVLETHEELLKGRQKFRIDYQHQAGDPLLREAISRFENEQMQTNYTSENMMLVSGALRGFSLVLDCLVKEGTHIVEIVPTYPLCAGQVRNILEKRRGLITTIIPEDIDTFQITFDEIEPHIQSSTIIYLTNPNNPTGLYLSKELLSSIVTTCENKGAYIIIDQACDIPLNHALDDNSYLNSPSVIRIRSLSKNFLLAGVRIGYIVASPQLIKIFSNSFSFSDGNAPRIANEVIIKYLNNSQLMPFISKVTNHKVEITLKKLAECGSILSVVKPEACFYIFLKINYSNNSWMLFKELISQGINVVPGCLFGVHSAPWIRLCCGREDQILIDHLDKLSKTLDSF
jgi:aspartate/methionine/tyrosine aminotransferase